MKTFKDREKTGKHPNFEGPVPRKNMSFSDINLETKSEHIQPKCTAPRGAVEHFRVTQEAQQTLLQNKINRVFIYSSSVMWTGGLVCEMNVCIVIKKKKNLTQTKKHPLFHTYKFPT